MMMVRLGAVLFVVVSVFFSAWFVQIRRVTDGKTFHIIAVTYVLSLIITLTLTGFTTQSRRYPQVTHYYR
jgi:uncharacterized membrane protein